MFKFCPNHLMSLILEGELMRILWAMWWRKNFFFFFHLFKFCCRLLVCSWKWDIFFSRNNTENVEPGWFWCALRHLLMVVRQHGQHVTHSAEKVIGYNLPSLQDLDASRTLKRAGKTAADPFQSGHNLFQTLSSGRRLDGWPGWKQPRHKNSFFSLCSGLRTPTDTVSPVPVLCILYIPYISLTVSPCKYYLIPCFLPFSAFSSLFFYVCCFVLLLLMHQTPRQNSSYMQASLAIKTRLIQILMKPHKKQWTRLSQTRIQTLLGRWSWGGGVAF